MGRVIKQPNNEISGRIEKGGKDRYEGEVGNAGTKVAASEGGETSESDFGAEITWLAEAPARAGYDVCGEGSSIKCGCQQQERHKIKDSVKGKQKCGEGCEDDDGDFESVAVEAVEVQ